jgi:phenylacetate-CoA ligase
VIVAQRSLVFALLRVLRVFRAAVASDNRTYRLLFFPGFERARWRIGQWRAWRAYELARKDVPAYRSFLTARDDPRPQVRRFVPDLSIVPETDKESYVRRYSIEERCSGGRIPRAGVMVDESSGTSGAPNNWVRGPVERRDVKQALQVAFGHQFGRGAPVFFLNAFALGPWATGMNVSMSLVDVTILKSVGPDVAKIEATLNVFGPRYRYVIAGYPPFLKDLIDSARVDWGAFDLTAVYGGEGMSEAMRAYLSRVFVRVLGSYGASDLEINLAAESDFTVALRRLLAGRVDLRQRLGLDAQVPLVFQYNPLDYYIETNDEGELVVTLARPGNAAPKIRYNIRDLGRVIRLPELRRELEAAGIDLRSLGPVTDLPLLLLAGRSDEAVPYFGSKLTPANVEEAIFSLPALAERVSSFALVVSEDDQATKRLAIAVELRPGAAPPSGLEALRQALVTRLQELNQDFREASRFMPEASVPTLEAHAAGTGPFAGHDVRLKRHYIQRRP